MVTRKLVFLFSKKQTNERNEKERKVLWEEKENDERERGPELKRTELRQKWIFSEKGIKTKGSKQGVEKTWKRHTLERRRFWQNDVHKKVCKQQKKRTNGREKTEKHRKRKKEQEMNKRCDKFLQRSSKNKLKKRKWKKQGFRVKEKSKRRSREEELKQRELWERREEKS